MTAQRLPGGDGFALVLPSPAYLPGYAEALRRGWSANTVMNTSAQELAQIAADPAAFLAGKVDREAKGPPVELPDGSCVARLPGVIHWIWSERDDGFAGSIGFRWQRGGSALPPHVLGHIGYSVVPWQRGRGAATRALALLLRRLPAEDTALDHVTITTDPDNLASQRVIEANGGLLLERFIQPAAFGGGEGLRYRIALTAR
jgi:predicted acetyltransferase